jgi:hypothetical protein
MHGKFVMSPIRYMLVVCFIVMLSTSVWIDSSYRSFYRTECETGEYGLDMRDYCAEDDSLFSILKIHEMYREFFFLSVIQTVLIAVCFGSSLKILLADDGFWFRFKAIVLMIVPVLALGMNWAYVAHEILLRHHFNCKQTSGFTFFVECDLSSRPLDFGIMLWLGSVLVAVLAIGFASFWYLYRYGQRIEILPHRLAYILSQAFSITGLLYLSFNTNNDRLFFYRAVGEFTLGYGVYLVLPVCLYAVIIYLGGRYSPYLSTVIIVAVSLFLVLTFGYFTLQLRIGFIVLAIYLSYQYASYRREPKRKVEEIP